MAKNDNKDRYFKVRCSAAELEALKTKAEAAGIDVSSFVRASVAKKQVIAAEDRSARSAAVREIAKVGNNLNQIARQLNSGQTAELSALAEIEHHLAQLRELLK